MAIVPTPTPTRRPQTRRDRFGRAPFNPLYCGTNGCTTSLRPDPARGVAVCPICGFTRPLRQAR